MGVHSKKMKIKFNLISAVLCQVITIGIGFILPRLYIENFGSSVNGVLSTIKQIFTYLCLLEAGVGLATSQALLAPVAKGDKNSINSILAATSQNYTRTGIIYSAAVAVIALVYGFAVDTGLPPQTVIPLVFLNGLPSMVTFFVQGKYQILLETDGRQYIITASQIALQIMSGFGKIAVLLLTDNLVLMQFSYCLFAVLQLLFVTFYARRQYKWLDFGVKANKAAISQKNSVLVHQISAMVFNNTDILLISFICDFKAVSVYSIYNLFFTQVETFVSSLVKGINFALGQLFSVDREKFMRKYDLYESCYIAVNFMIYTLMCVFLLPIIRIYTGGISDADYINPTLIFLFSLSKLTACVKLPSNRIVEYSGDFKKTTWHAFAEMTINIVVSVFGVMKWGICGALAGTVAALLFRAVAVIYFSNKKVLGRSVGSTCTIIFANFAVFALVCFVFGTSRFLGMNFGRLVLHGILNSLWIMPLYALANLLARPRIVGEIKSILKNRGEKA